MHLLAAASTAAHVASRGPFLDSLLDLLYSSSLSASTSLLGKIPEPSVNRVISLLVSLISVNTDVKRALCQDVFLKECFCLYISFKVISTLCLLFCLGNRHAWGSSVMHPLSTESVTSKPSVKSRWIDIVL